MANLLILNMNCCVIDQFFHNHAQEATKETAAQASRMLIIQKDEVFKAPMV